MTVPPLNGIDHIHVYVPSRRAAARWYRETLGFEVAEEFAFWTTDEGGPMTLRDPGDTVHLALFRSAEAKPCSIALGTDAASYTAWRSHFHKAGLEVREADHKSALSLYISDPYGNQIEFTTYDVKGVGGGS